MNNDFYKVIVESTLSEFMSLQQWCLNNCKGSWHFETLSSVDSWGKRIRYRWFFTNPEDFTLFSLKYGV